MTLKHELDQLAAIYGVSGDEHLAGLFKRAASELSRLQARVVELEKHKQLLDRIAEVVPRPPLAITYERGWQILDVVQAAVVKRDAAMRGKEEG